MVKLITPIGMLITVALLAMYAAYAFWTAYVDESWIYGLLGALSLVACYGTAMLRPWSQYLVYLLTTLFIACMVLLGVFRCGSRVFQLLFFLAPARGQGSAPGLALVVLSCVASWNAFSHFRRARRLG